MKLGNEAIIKARDEGKILISPFREEQLNGNSYDVRLDQHFIQFSGSKDIIIDLTRGIPEHLMHYRKGSNVLGPQMRCLAVTIEEIGSTSCDLVPMIASKSSWARSGLEVCACAGFGDCGYYDKWTLEIYNKNPFSILLKPGLLVGQVFFEQVMGCSKLYKSRYNDKSLSIIERMTPKEIKQLWRDVV